MGKTIKNNEGNIISKSKILNQKLEFEGKTFDFEIEEIAPEIDTGSLISFHNCIFERRVSFKNIKIDWILFINCQFHNNLVLESLEVKTLIIGGCEFDERVILHNNIVEEKLNIESCKSHEAIMVTGDYKDLLIWSTQAKFINILDVNTESNFLESNIEFLGDNEIDKLEIQPYSTFSKIIFRQKGKYKHIAFEGVFNSPILFEGNIEVEYLFFESSTFNNRIDIQQGSYGYINFYRSLFKGLIWINGYDVIEKIKKELQIKRLTLHSNTFERNVTVNTPKLECLNLSNNYFHKLFQISSEIHKQIDLKNDVSINIDGTNQGNLLIQEIQSNLSLGGINLGNINLKNIVFSDLYIRDFQNKGHVSFFNILSGSRFTIQDSSVGNLEFLNTNTNDFDEIVIADSNLENISFSIYPHKVKSYSSNPKVGYGIDDKSRNTSNLRHVYNQLKQVARKKGDIDIANKYQSLEYKQLLLNKRFGFDKLLLFLNWLSNNNGRSWFRGVLFTLIVAFLFFCIYLSVLRISFDYAIHLKEYILFITSFPKLQLEKYAETNMSWQVSLVIWLSRIFISYGIYQTVAAFRKYGKG